VLHSEVFDTKHGWPLFKRGWVFQELLLSTRILFFGSSELIWECQEGMECECSAVTYSGTKLRRWSGESAQWIARTRLLDGSPSTVAKRWRELVTEYSALQLTKAEDRLPALSGLSKFFSPKKMQYLAGIWRDSLFEDLLWVASDPVKKPQRWRAPTWSWASIDSEISEFYPFQSSDATCSILGADCTSNGPDRFGEVSSGFLRISGFIFPATLYARLAGIDNRYDVGVLGEFSSYEFHLRVAGRLYFWGVHIDYLLDFRAGWTKTDLLNLERDEPVHLVAIGEAFGLSHFLVLSCLDCESQSYERIGITRESVYKTADMLKHIQEKRTINIF